MGNIVGKKKPTPEEAYAAVKVNNMETLADLLPKGCDPNDSSPKRRNNFRGKR